MPRWEPNAHERLADAALTLFADRGYDDTKVDDIAAAAGLTRSTFFRHFRDKAEILFTGQEGLADDIATGIETAPAQADPLDVVRLALVGLADRWFPESRRDGARTRATVIAANAELRERELHKRAAITTALTEGLRSRGVDDDVAEVAGQLGALGLDHAVARWVAGEPHDFPTLLDSALHGVARTTQRLLEARAGHTPDDL